MKLYIDSDFKCYVTDDGTMTEVETTSFNGKCQEFIEGYRFVPLGKEWMNSDGFIFTGEMIAPWKDYVELDAAQREYEQQLLLDYQTENSELKAQQNELITSYNEGINSI